MKNAVLNKLKQLGVVFFLGMAISPTSWALQVDWSGQFWSEFHGIQNYTLNSSPAGHQYDAAKVAAGGYYVPGSGTNAASFQTLFFRLRPKVIVNDNIYVKSEWWVGDPIFGIFGSGVPYSADQNQHYSSQNRGFPISAQRIWVEFLTDIGTFQVGRVPLEWGLGLYWNKGEDLYSRYMSTGDAIRWIGKFGSFSFMPSLIVNSAGNTIAGSCVAGATGVCTPGSSGTGGVNELSIAIKYEDKNEELEGGINMIRRLGGSAQDSPGGFATPPQTAGATRPNNGAMNFTVFDIYAKKKFRHFSLGAELPIVTGSLSGARYESYALATEIGWNPSTTLDFNLRSGYVPGQPNSSSATIDTFRAFYVHPNYNIGMIMFNYQLANFAGPQTQNNIGISRSALRSPYDNPIVDAAYFALSSDIRATDKWTFKPALVYAMAPSTAKAGQYYFNYWDKTVRLNNSGRDQGSTMGFEIDLGIEFKYDDNFTFNLDTGVFVPGNFYEFSNTTTMNRLNPVFAAAARVGVTF